MVYNNFFIRIITSIFLIILFIYLIYETQYIIFFIYFIYFLILIKLLIYFRKNLLILILSLFYLSLSFLSIIYYLDNFFDKILLIYTILIVTSFDTFSYLFGSYYGNKKITPVISPNKTYIGLFSGILSSIIIIFFINYFVNYFSQYSLLIYTITLILFSFIGDIFQSFLKRKSMIKNSSNFLPGHGGFFDRFDSLIMVFLYLFIYNFYFKL